MPRQRATVQVYGKQSRYLVGGTSSIYGGIQIQQLLPDCACTPTVDPKDALKSLLVFLDQLKNAIADFYVGAHINAPLVAKMTVRGAISFGIFARLEWGRRNPGNFFDKSSPSDINSLKDVYLSLGRDWRMDTFFSKTEFIYT
jgi:hypothetical protein